MVCSGGAFSSIVSRSCIFFFQAEDGIRDSSVTGVQTCALPISFRVPVVLGRSAPMICRRIKTPSNILTVGIPAAGGEVPEGFVQLLVGSRPGSPDRKSVV